MPRISCNGIKLNFKSIGTGEPLVLLMGWGATLNLWMFQLPAFKELFRVIVLDNRGVGKSDKPGGRWTSKLMADDTVGLLDALNISKAHILGYSMGGMIAQEIAINYPERVAKLVLVSSYAVNDGKMNGLTQEIVDPETLPVKKSIAFVRSRISGSRTLGSKVFRAVQSFQLAFMGKEKTAGLQGQLDAIINHDTFGRLSEIKAPTLILVGTNDRVIRPSSSETLASKIPNARLVKFERVSHSPITDCYSQFNAEVIDFLVKK